MSSFRFLTQAEAERIPLYRLKVNTVGKGDTFRSISKRFYGTPDKAGEIMEFNGITDELFLRPGEEIEDKTYRTRGITEPFRDKGRELRAPSPPENRT